ncbi:MAG: lysophospholipid acyltransferase family protein [Candidatus Omnitrophota bacterium]
MFFYYISRFVIEVILRFIFFFRLKVTGRESFPKKGPFLIIANHLSYLDPLVVGISCPRRIVFLARQDLFNFWPLGAWMKAVGVIALKRDSADLYALRRSLESLKKGNCLAIFPEGRRIENLSLSFKEIKRGFLLLAKKAQVPIIVAKIYGTQEALSKSSKWIKFATKICVNFSQPLFIAKDEDYDTALKRFDEVVSKL